MRRLLAVAVIAVNVFSSGCSQDSDKPSGKQLDWGQALREVAGRPVKPAETEMERLTHTVGALRETVASLNLDNIRYKSAVFDPTGPRHYQRVDANVGYFLVVLENVEPYLDGQKVTLLIGNPNSVTFLGFEIIASWSARWPEASKLPLKEQMKAEEAYRASVGEKEIKLTDTLRPGTWSKVRITIAPAKSEEFGQLSIGIRTDQVMLAGGR